MRRPKRRFFLLAAALALLAVIICQPFCERLPVGGEVTVQIPAGSSAADIAALLAGAGVIADEGDFRDRAEDLGVGQELKSGTYRFTRGEPLESILNKLSLGLQAPEGVLTVPEGYGAADIAALVAERTGISEGQYLAATAAGVVSLPLAGAPPGADLEGFLFPSTYDLGPDLTAAGLVAAQVERFREGTDGAAWERAAALGLSEYEVLIVASLIEREARVPEERPLVAAVVYNRLAAGMRLEIDASVQYAIGAWKEELTQADLDTDSAYNTRLYAGLPPGPICNPGLASIEAALDPADVDYIYYVATGDEAGHHFFTASFEEFLAAQQGP